MIPLKKQLPIIGMSVILLIVIFILGTYRYPSQKPNTITGLVADTNPNEEKRLIMAYYVVPSFEAKADYDLNEYEAIVSSAKDLIVRVRKCLANLGKTGEDVSESDIQKCVEKNKNTGWVIAGHDRLKYRFDVKGKNKLPKYNPVTNKIEDTEVIYKFALDFEEEPAP